MTKPDEIFIEPKPATWGAMLFSETDPKNGRAVSFTRTDLCKTREAELLACIRDLDLDVTCERHKFLKPAPLTNSQKKHAALIAQATAERKGE